MKKNFDADIYKMLMIKVLTELSHFKSLLPSLRKRINFDIQIKFVPTF